MRQNSGRVVMSQRNFGASMLTKLVTMITSFVSRTVFIKILGAEYLGLGGFFGNIFAVVSLCELGFSAAVAQSLYKPLSENNGEKVSAIVAYFEKCTRIIACASLSMSACAFPFLGKIVKSSLDIGEIRAAFVLFSLHTFVSYLLLPKRTLVICDQRMYVVSLTRCVFSVIGLAVQVMALVLFRSYLCYLASRIIVIVLEDISVNAYADRAYPYLSLVRRVDKEYKKGVYRNVRALAWHKLGTTLSGSTDSILLSYFVGLSGMGKYSNYALVIGTAGSFFDAAVGAVSASVGNLGAGDRGKKSERIMRKMYFINFWLVTVGACVLVSCVGSVVELWLGKDMCFGNPELIVIVMSFFVSCIRDPVQIFIRTYGLFRESRHIPILRAAANLLFSVLLVKRMGVAGVFLGTVLSTLLIPMPLEVAVLYKHGFSMSATGFVRNELLGYLMFAPVCGAVCFLLTAKIPVTALGVAVRVLVSIFVSNLLLFLFYSENEMFCESKCMVLGMASKLFKRKK